MDNSDIRILAELRRNSRLSLSDLADSVGLSRVTVRSRMTKLQKDGVIVGFTVILAEDIEAQPIRSLMMLGIEGRGTNRISRMLRGIRAVNAIHATNGKWDLIVELGTQTLRELDAVLSQIRELDGVMVSETNLLLATHMTARG